MVTPVFVNARAPITVQADRMAQLTARMGKLQAQISTGQRFNTPSEAPVEAQRAAALDRLMARIASEERVIDRAAGRLALAETAIGTAVDALQRARELGLAMANGTSSEEDRQIYTAELSVLRQQLLGAANMRDEAGRYLFAGATAATPAFAEDAEGVIRWAGFATGAGADGAGVAQAAPPAGPGLFGSDPDGTFAAIDRLLLAASPSTALTAEERDAETAQRALDVAAALDGIELGAGRLATGQALLGAGLARMESEQLRLERARLDASEGLARARGLDITAAIADLAALELTLGAARQSFARLFSGTLFDQLR